MGAINRFDLNEIIEETGASDAQLWRLKIETKRNYIENRCHAHWN